MYIILQFHILLSSYLRKSCIIIQDQLLNLFLYNLEDLPTVVVIPRRLARKILQHTLPKEEAVDRRCRQKGAEVEVVLITQRQLLTEADMDPQTIPEV